MNNFRSVGLLKILEEIEKSTANACSGLRKEFEKTKKSMKTMTTTMMTMETG